MNHGELVVAFALSWPVYFILYIGVGLFSIVELIIFYIFHYLANREKRPTFVFFAYFRPIYPQIFEGLIITCFILIVPLFTCSIIMLGSFMDLDLSGCGDEDMDTEGSVCHRSVFDYLDVYIIDIFIYIFIYFFKYLKNLAQRDQPCGPRVRSDSQGEVRHRDRRYRGLYFV